MSLSMYELSIPPLLRALENLSTVLRKGEAFCVARKIDPEILTHSRLAPDMLPLARQIHIATDVAKGCAARLSGMQPPQYDDVEFTFPELEARLQKTIQFMRSVDASAFKGSEDKSIEFKIAGRPIQMTGLDYVLNFVKPNVFFHSTVAYSILRHNGVKVGKRDFLGG